MEQIYEINGMTFTNRRDYRDYCIQTFYSFKDKSNEICIKHPNEIQSNSFEISDCMYSKLIIMDITDSVQIDNLKFCKVFIGACINSIFIRNCETCIFYTSSRQVRLREVKNSIMCSFTQSTIHIEECHNLKFTPFQGGYKDHQLHLKHANLDSVQNLWYDIFDHNDIEKSNCNFQLLSVEDYNKPWLPDGYDTLTDINTTMPISTHEMKEELHVNQVGKSFGFDQLIKDNANAIPTIDVSSVQRIPRNEREDIEQLSTELSLLVILAKEKDIDFESKLNSDSIDGLVTVEVFISQLLELTDELSRDNDCDESTKADIQNAISDDSLTSTLRICKVDHALLLLFDLKYFFHLCEKKYQYLTGEGNDADITSNIDLESHSIIESIPDFPSKAVQISRDDSYVSNKTIEIESVTNAKLPSTIKQAFEDFYDLQKDVVDDIKDEIELTIEKEKESLETKESQVIQPIIVNIPLIPSKQSKKKIITPMISKRNNHNKGISSNGIMNTNNSKAPSVISNSSMLPASNRPITSYNPMDSDSQTNTVTTISLNTFTSIDHLNEQQLSLMQLQIEDMLRKTVSQTDLLHKIQVHLGFLNNYLSVPARGVIIQSKAKPFLTIQDLQKGFQAGRLRLNDLQIRIVFLLVDSFAKEWISNSSPSDESNLSLGQVIGSKGQTLNASWLKKYFTYLRLSKNSHSQNHETLNMTKTIKSNKSILQQRDEVDTTPMKTTPVHWEQWLSHKTLLEKMKQEEKPNEFRRALAGQSYQISNDEINHFIAKFQIIPDNILHDEIQYRLECWLLDVDGRREFKHLMNLEINKWSKENHQRYQKLSKERQNEVFHESRKKVMKAKIHEYKKQEFENQKLTKELFWRYRYEIEVSLNSLTTTTPSRSKSKALVLQPIENSILGNERVSNDKLIWGKWLEKYRKKVNEKLEIMKEEHKKRIHYHVNETIEQNKVIPLQQVKKLVDNLSENPSISLRNSLELRKSLVQLCKDLEVGECKLETPLVTKKMFKDHFGPVFQQVSIDTSVEFYEDPQDACQLGVLIESEDNELKVKAYNEWIETKAIELKTLKLKEEELKVAKEQENHLKVVRGMNAFKKWLRYRKKNKYISKVSYYFITNIYHVIRLIYDSD